MTALTDDVIRRHAVHLEGLMAWNGLTDRATAYAALAHARLLSSEWTHVVEVKEGKERRLETVVKPAGQLFGGREVVEKHFLELLEALGIPALV